MEQRVALWFSTTSPRMCNLFLWIHLCLSPKSAPWFINPSGNQPDLQNEIQANGQIPHPLWVVIKCPSSREGKGVKCPGYGQGGMLKLWFDWYIITENSQLYMKLILYRFSSIHRWCFIILSYYEIARM